MENDGIREFYDDYVGRQQVVGVNERHWSIRDLVRAEGLRPDMRVLEMGCGIGTLTGLLAGDLPQGRLIAVDLSPVSIEQAGRALQACANVELRVADVVSDELPGPFDRIVLPDVLEHVPSERHGRLFLRIKALLAPNGRVIVHSPDPYYAEYLQREHPELLQVVDQALHIGPLVAVVEAAGLVVSKFQRYSIWTDAPDYMVLVIEHVPAGHVYRQLPQVPVTWTRRLMQRLKRMRG